MRAVQRWVYYAGTIKEGKALQVRIGLSEDPEADVRSLGLVTPYPVQLLGAESGDDSLLEARKASYHLWALQNGWYKPHPLLLKHIEGLTPVTFEVAIRKVCVEWLPAEYRELQEGMERHGFKTQSKLIRRATFMYLRLRKYQARGYLLHVLKHGKMRVIPDLDKIKDPDDEGLL